MSNWDSDEDTPALKSGSPAPVVKKPVKTKWDGEDEDEKGPASDWEESSEEEEDKPTTTAVAPPKKKGTLKAKLAEKEAQKAARKAAGEDEEAYDSDEVLDPREKARRDKEREVETDLKNAAELFGGNSQPGTKPDELLQSVLQSQPKTKEDFHLLSKNLIDLIKRHQNKPLYATFVEHHVRELCAPLKDVEVRKAASGLTTLANEKQREQRESGKKKSKSTSKPILGTTKSSAKLDTDLYDEALDDFGTGAEDFM